MNPVIIGNATLLLGDCVEVMAGMSENSLDAIVTDPPYLISFMSKSFDSQHKSLAGENEGQQMQAWHSLWVKEAYRVLKPGGYLIAAGGARTYHRLASAVEDIGFELRDCIMWTFSSGFPKSRNIGKEIKEYEGFGTALKPAYEPFVMARKPLSESTVAENVLKHGTGAINIDASRVGIDVITSQGSASLHLQKKCLEHRIRKYEKGLPGEKFESTTHVGRWPPHLLLDGSDEVVKLFPDRKTTWVSQDHANNRSGEFLGKLSHPGQQGFNDSGSAARFFPHLGYSDHDIPPLKYCAKASKSDRGEYNTHPTCKPTELMRWLCRLVLPPNGTVLDHFMGSGSTLKAACLENMKCVGIEMNEEYFEIAKARVEHAQQQSSLF
jgi:site-specific DNA-methyltransferase (adenine-specific)